MDNPKKGWITPELQIFGDIEELTQQGRAKGQGTGDSLNSNPANANTGPFAAAVVS